MAGKSSTELNSVLPMGARVSRIAAGSGLAASSHEFPPGKDESPRGYHAAGSEPDGLDFIMPHAADSRTADSLSGSRSSDPDASFPNDNPT